VGCRAWSLGPTCSAKSASCSWRTIPGTKRSRSARCKSTICKAPVVVTRDGVEALDYLLPAGGNAAQPLPELVLLDLKLPKLDGLEVLRRLRDHERTRRLPVVILTSSAEERDILEGYRLGTNSYVRKPVDFAEFTEAVRYLGLYWLILNTAPPAQ
jgi:two-component system response regulator